MSAPSGVHRPRNDRLREAAERVEEAHSQRFAALRAQLYVDVAFEKAADVLGTDDGAVEWLVSVEIAFDGKAPVQLLGDPAGLRRVLRQLDELQRKKAACC